MTPDDGSRTKLDARTWLPIGLTASLLATAVYGTAMVVSGFKDLTSGQDELVVSGKATADAVQKQGAAIQLLSDDMYRVRLDLNSALADPWGKSDMVVWVLSAQQALDRAGIKVELPPAQGLSGDPKGQRK